MPGLSWRSAPASPVAVAVELDRGTEDQKRWRAKVQALALWADGPYQQAFTADTLTIAVVAPDQRRRDLLRSWTDLELTHRGAPPELAELFLLTCADPVRTTPSEFFFGRCWYEPTRLEPVSLLPSPLKLVVPATENATEKEVWPAQE